MWYCLHSIDTIYNSTSQGRYECNVQKAQQQSQQFRGSIQLTRDLSDHHRLLDRKIRALKRIIYIKTHPHTVKKIFYDGYTNGERIDFRGL